VFPFILRGVKLLGIDVVWVDMGLRREVWERLAGDLRCVRLATDEITLDDLPSAFSTLLEGGARGRIVVNLSTA
jgi:acrylyl-CoA reductase (NADPH)